MRIADRARLLNARRAGAFWAAAWVLGVSLSGCATLDRRIQPPPVNPSSPIAPYAEEVSRETFPKPSFLDVPPKPGDVRSADQYKSAVLGEIEFRRQLAAWRAANPQLTSDTDAWADLQRRAIPRSAATPVPTTQDAESAAFAKRLREEAIRSQTPTQPQP